MTGLYWDRPSKYFEGTYQIQCASGVQPLQLAIRNLPGFGSSLKRELREYNAMHVNMNMQGMLGYSAKIFTDLDPEREDRFGVPLPRVHLHYSESDVAMARDMAATCEELIRLSGGQVHSTPQVSAQTLVIDGNHWAGSCRMGTDPKSSVVNTECRTHDVANLYIGDASVFAHYPEKNPTLSNIALAWRTSDRLVERFRKGEV